MNTEENIKKCRNFDNSKSSGFALIASLSLMAFIFLILLSLSSFVQIENRVGSTRLHEQTARMNALYGLNVAVGELQKYAGPDMRITARSDIMGEFTDEGEFGFTFNKVENPNYTLVWDVSGNENDTNPPGPTDRPEHNPDLKPAVLVSGNELEDFDISNDVRHPGGYIDENTDLTFSQDAVWIVGGKDREYESFIGEETELINVVVKKQNIGKDGNYAYWVGDEGVKARINLAVSGEQEEPYTWTTAQRHGIQAIERLDDLDTFTLSKAISMNTMLLANKSELEEDKNYISEKLHDLTAHSKGVLADVQHGRLKRDLSYVLEEGNESDGTADSDPVIEEMEYTANYSSQSAKYTDRANVQYCNWGVLRDYYNMDGNVDSIESVPHMEGQEGYNMGFTPIIARFHWGFTFKPEKLQRGSRVAYIPYLYHLPSVTLWNPYNVDMEITNDMCVSFMQHHGGAEGKNETTGETNKVKTEHQISFKIGWETTSGSIVDDRYEFSVRAPSATIAGGVTIPAGEAVVFSPRGDDNEYWENSSSYGVKPQYNRSGLTRIKPGVSNRLYPEWESGGAFKQWVRYSNTIGSSGRFAGNQEQIQLPANLRALRVRQREESDEDEPLSEQRNRHIVLGYFNDNPPSPRYHDVDRIVSLHHLSGDIHSDSDKLVTIPVNDEDGVLAPHFLYLYVMGFSDDGNIYTPNERTPIQWLGNFNPRASVFNEYADALVDDPLKHYPLNYLGGYMTGDDALDNYEPQGGSVANLGNTYYDGASQAAVFDIPKNPLTSIAQLGHADITQIDNEHSHVWDNYSMTDETHEEWNFSWNRGAGNYHAPGYAIGSSLAPPFINLNETFSVFDVAGDYMYNWDYSYLLNEALYDHYFFSSVPRGGYNSTTILPNGLYETIGPEATLSEDLSIYDRAASRLMVNGAFNVNSTSVDAWTALLASTRNSQVMMYDDSMDSSDENTPYTRLLNPYSEALDESDLSAAEPVIMQGYRQLDDEEIRELAQRIVDQVKLRGPFPSMSAFVNRLVFPETSYKKDMNMSKDIGNPNEIYEGSLSGREYMALKGALEAALDLSVANQGFFDDDIYFAREEIDRKAFAGSMAAHTPGYLSQMDLLSRLDPVMNVRSDTFVIRAYGDASDPGGSGATATMRCEAIVQRYPEFVIPMDTSDDSDKGKGNEAWEEFDDLSTENSRLGRKFRVVSLRWLSGDEI